MPRTPRRVSRTRRFVLQAQAMDESWSWIHDFGNDKKRAFKALDDMTVLPERFRVVEEITTLRVVDAPLASVEDL